MMGKSDRSAEKKDKIAWECGHCGHRHLWTWEHGEAIEGDVLMHCDACKAMMRTELVQIGRCTWTALWPGLRHDPIPPSP